MKFNKNIYKKLNKKVLFSLSFFIVFSILMCSALKNGDLQSNLLSVNAKNQLSNKKICWGIKRVPNHEQPDVGSSNKSLLENYNGICLGNKDKKKVYLTFDSRIWGWIYG